jgi:hypothetical protein
MRRFSRLSAVGAPLLVPALRAYENSEGSDPRPHGRGYSLSVLRTWSQNEALPAISFPRRLVNLSSYLRSPVSLIRFFFSR